MSNLQTVTWTRYCHFSCQLLTICRYRHQLNHNSKQTYVCDFPDCTRTFVRGDLLKRHMDRHTAKGSQLNRRDSMVSHASAAPGSASPEMNRPTPGFPKGRQQQMQYQSPQDPSGSPYTPLSHTPPTAFPNGTPAAGPNGYAHDSPYGSAASHRVHQQSGQSRPTVETNVAPYGVLSPVSNQPGYHSQQNGTPHSTNFVSQQNVLPFNLPPSQYSNAQSAQRDAEHSYATTTTGDYAESAHTQSSSMMILDQIAMPGTVPVFGGDGALNKSPYVGMPEDFMAYLFNSPPGDGSGSPMSQVMPAPYSK